MLLDFFFKKIILKIMYYFFYLSNIIFSEKYFIEYNFLQFKKLQNYLTNFIDYYSNEFIYSVISIIVFFFVIVLILLNG